MGLRLGVNEIMYSSIRNLIRNLMNVLINLLI